MPLQCLLLRLPLGPPPPLASCGIKGECYAPNATSCPAILSLSCGTGVFTGVSFANYGNPQTTGPNCSFAPGNCSAPSAPSIVAAACVGRSECAIDVTVATFGQDPCPGIYKFLAVQLQGACSPAPPGAQLCALSGYSRTFSYVNETGTGLTYYQRLQPRNDAPAPRAIPYALNPPTGGVALNGGVLGAASDAAVKYLLNHYTVDNLLFNFRKRAGLPQPPGAKCMGWDCQADWCVLRACAFGAAPFSLSPNPSLSSPSQPLSFPGFLSGLRARQRASSSWARAATCGGGRFPSCAP